MEAWIGFAWAAGLTVLALVISLSLYFVLRDDSAKPTAANPSLGASATVSATVSAPSVVIPSGTASSTPSPAGKAAPGRRIPGDVLKNTTLVIPPWPQGGLASGPLKFANGVYSDPSGNGTLNIWMVRIIYGDVDRDGAQETVAAFHGGLAGSGKQLPAFDRDGTGRIVTRGTVLATTRPDRQAIRQFDLNTFRIESTGVVTVRVADYAGCCGDETQPQWQWRSYGWNGHGFGTDKQGGQLVDSDQVNDDATVTVRIAG